VPEIGPGQLLIKVAAAGVNRPDVLQRKGMYPVPPGASPIPGLGRVNRYAPWSMASVMQSMAPYRRGSASRSPRA
jgi:hypothetical protein